MRPVSDSWASIVAGSYKAAVEAHLYSPDGEFVSELPLVSGTVNLDGTAAVRGSCDLELQGTEWVPVDVTDRLAPYGSEINVLKGHAVGDGELVSLGWFGIEDLEVTDDGAGLGVRVTGMDRFRRFQYALIEDDITFAADVPFMQIILALAQGAWADVPVAEGFLSVSNISVGKPLFALAGEETGERMQDLALNAGVALFFNGDGELDAVPYTVGEPVAEISEGDGGVLVQASRTWTRANSFNKVIATGEDSGAADAARGEAVDDDPQSPTYYYGPFGHAPRFYSHSDIDSDEQATHVAETILEKEAGTASSVNFGLVPNPALEPFDSVLIRRERAGINAVHVVDSLSIGLGAGEVMTGSTRERLVV